MLLSVFYLYQLGLLYVIGYLHESQSVICKVRYSFAFTRGLKPYNHNSVSYNYGYNYTSKSHKKSTLCYSNSENVLIPNYEATRLDNNPPVSHHISPAGTYPVDLGVDTKFNETNSASEISSLCSYEDNPHLLQQLQSRLDNYRKLSENYSVNPFPEIKSDEGYDDIAKVLSENQDLENGQEVERVYKIFGRIEAVRFDGHFMDLVNINKKFENYLNEDLTLKKLQRNNKIQVMFRLEELVELEGSAIRESELNLTGHPCKEIVNLVDVGDVLEITGNVKKTNLGEISILPKKVRFLSKCLIPPPSKLHGLKDVETRFRLRHLDLMTNEESRRLLLKRFQIIGKIKRFLSERGFVEIDTPTLQHYTSGDLAEPFETFYKRLQQNVKLRIAPEFSIKRVLMGLPLNKVFEMGKCFRNEGTSLTHSPEFTMIEIYQKMADYNQMINLLEELVNDLLSYKFQVERPEVQGELKDEPSKPKTIVETVPCEYVVKWARKTFSDLIREYTEVEITKYTKRELEEKLRELESKDSEHVQKSRESTDPKFETWGDVANEIFEKFVVPKLTYPVHVTNLPREISPLTYYNSIRKLGHSYNQKSSDVNYSNSSYSNSDDNETEYDNELFSNRFESYLGGMEVANGSTEQCNPLILSKNLLKQSGDSAESTVVGGECENEESDLHLELTSHSPLENTDRAKTDSSPNTCDKRKEVDREFLHSAFCGMEPMAGLGIGVDRLVMYLTKTKNIKEILPLPSLRKQ